MNKNIIKTIAIALVFGIGVGFTPSIAHAEGLPELTLPDVNFEKPENFPDINMDLSSEYDTIMKDLESKGFGKVTMNLKDQALDTTWSNQGSKNKLSEKEFNSYLSNVEKKYLPQIQSSKEQSSGIKYDKIDLKGKWDLMSYNEAKKQSSSLPNYNELKSQLQSSAKMPSLPKATLSYTTPSEFQSHKNQVIANSNQTLTPKFSSLPNGVTMNENGQITDNREKIGLWDTISYGFLDGTVGITKLKDGFDRFVSEATGKKNDNKSDDEIKDALRRSRKGGGGSSGAW